MAAPRLVISCEAAGAMASAFTAVAASFGASGRYLADAMTNAAVHDVLPALAISTECVCSVCPCTECPECQTPCSECGSCGCGCPECGRAGTVAPCTEGCG